MKLNQFVNLLNFDKIDEEEVKDMAARRGFLTDAGNFSAKAALAAIPGFLLAALPKVAKAGITEDAVAVLNYALTLEYLERNFYNMYGIQSYVPSTASPIINQITADERAHVEFLKAAISGAGGTPIAEPNFDYTKGVGAPIADYATFLAVAQVFEDTGVRAYKGRAGELAKTDTLTAALNIHSVEARHAAQLRILRMKAGDTATKPWITGNSRGMIPAAFQATYNGEENTIQGGVNLSTVNVAGVTISASALSEAFDEPLTKEAVLDIVTPFFA